MLGSMAGRRSPTAATPEPELARNLGYPRTVQRPDCKVETMCYFNDAPENERYLAASIRDAGH